MDRKQINQKVAGISISLCEASILREDFIGAMELSYNIRAGYGVKDCESKVFHGYFLLIQKELNLYLYSRARAETLIIDSESFGRQMYYLKVKGDSQYKFLSLMRGALLICEAGHITVPGTLIAAMKALRLEIFKSIAKKISNKNIEKYPDDDEKAMQRFDSLARSYKYSGEKDRYTDLLTCCIKYAENCPVGTVRMLSSTFELELANAQGGGASSSDAASNPLEEEHVKLQSVMKELIAKTPKLRISDSLYRASVDVQTFSGLSTVVLNDYTFFPKVKKADLKEDALVGFYKTDVEIHGFLYHGYSHRNHTVSFLVVPDQQSADRMYGVMSRSYITGMISPRSEGFPSKQIKKHLIAVEKINSLEYWRVDKVQLIPDSKQYIAVMETHFISIFRQVISAILCFLKHKILPGDLRVSICIDESDRVTLIPSIENYVESRARDYIKEIRDQLLEVVSRFFFPTDDYKDDLTPTNCDRLSVEVGEFCSSLKSLVLWDIFGVKTLFAHPCFWTHTERALFIRALFDMHKKRRLPYVFWNDHFKIYVRGYSKHPKWDDLLVDNVLTRVLENKNNENTEEGDQGSVSRLDSDIIRFVTNVLRHYIDNNGYVEEYGVMQRVMTDLPFLITTVYRSFYEASKPVIYCRHSVYVLAMSSLISKINF